MAKLAAISRLPLSDPRRSTLDVSWTFSLHRTPGSDELAARMTCAALDTLGPYGQVSAQLAAAITLACGYVVDHGLAHRYRVTLGVDGARCTVSVTDYGYDKPLTVPPDPPHSYAATALCQQLAHPTENGARIDGVQVHHATDGAVLIRFRALLPAAPADAADDSAPGLPQPPPAAPDHSRSPGARG
ncbi:hypothetical protein G3I60_19980 [Streptomyces sp. SID13666]|uniref:hypothetical protein n=1 Tax=unclassified Streptomyces TaxID=2593676 RepID=UPI0013BFF5F8|nr:MULTISPECIES: hypothetical protein [unclassified Streptomyces]NEA56361.1 hypothetical protein [Streptomyces sp. SID13666]NEA73721.1 hypothetical protein [Streptomyces sp. SID13588]